MSSIRSMKSEVSSKDVQSWVIHCDSLSSIHGRSRLLLNCVLVRLIIREIAPNLQFPIGHLQISRLCMYDFSFIFLLLLFQFFILHTL